MLPQFGTSTTTKPPGLAQRPMSWRRSIPLGTCSSTWNAATTSKLRSGNPASCTSAVRTSRPRARAISADCSTGSAPATSQPRAAATARTSPDPQPTSRNAPRCGRTDSIDAEPLAGRPCQELLEERMREVQPELGLTGEVALDVDLVRLAVLGRVDELAGGRSCAARAGHRGRWGWTHRHRSRGTSPAGGSSWRGDSTRRPSGLTAATLTGPRPPACLPVPSGERP